MSRQYDDPMRKTTAGPGRHDNPATATTRPPAPAGFTLPELALVLAIVGILASLALVPAGRAVDQASVRAASDEIASAIAAARQLALMRGAFVTATIDTVDGRIAIETEGELTRTRELEAIHHVSLSATRTTIRFAPNGLGHGVSNLRIIARRRTAADTIFVSRTGRVRR